MSSQFLSRVARPFVGAAFAVVAGVGLASAQTPAPAAPAPAPGMAGMSGAAAGATALPPLVQVPSVVEPGEQVAAGDVMSFARQFDAWAMMCVRRVVSGRQVCGLNQTLRGEGETGAQVHVGPDVAGSFQMIISLVGGTEKDGGPTLSYGAVERKFDAGKMRCTALGCAGVVPFDQAMITALKDIADVKIKFTNLKGAKTTLVMPLAGFGAAFNAAASDPMGFRVAQAAQQAQPQAGVSGMAGMSGMDAPAAAPKAAEKPAAAAKPKAK